MKKIFCKNCEDEIEYNGKGQPKKWCDKLLCQQAKYEHQKKLQRKRRKKNYRKQRLMNGDYTLKDIARKYAKDHAITHVYNKKGKEVSLSPQLGGRTSFFKNDYGCGINEKHDFPKNNDGTHKQPPAHFNMWVEQIFDEETEEWVLYDINELAFLEENEEGLVGEDGFQGIIQGTDISKNNMNSEKIKSFDRRYIWLDKSNNLISEKVRHFFELYEEQKRYIDFIRHMKYNHSSKENKTCIDPVYKDLDITGFYRDYVSNGEEDISDGLQRYLDMLSENGSCIPNEDIVEKVSYWNGLSNQDIIFHGSEIKGFNRKFGWFGDYTREFDRHKDYRLWWENKEY